MERDANLTLEAVVGVATGVTITGTATGTALCSFLREDFELKANLTEDAVVGVATATGTPTGVATGTAVWRILLSAVAATMKRAEIRAAKNLFILYFGSFI